VDRSQYISLIQDGPRPSRGARFVDVILYNPMQIQSLVRLSGGAGLVLCHRWHLASANNSCCDMSCRHSHTLLLTLLTTFCVISVFPLYFLSDSLLPSARAGAGFSTSVGASIGTDGSATSSARTSAGMSGLLSASRTHCRPSDGITKTKTYHCLPL
jgi:hypothetical protein